jgi:NAD-dependent DNA ligase
VANFFTRQSAAYGNQMRQFCGVLIGLANGLVADQILNDAEIRFLTQWLEQHDEIASVWPGDVLHQRIKTVLADGVITEEERAHLMQTLTLLIGGQLESLATSPQVNQLAIDDVHEIAFASSSFCLTGTFAFGPRNACVRAIEQRGGEIKTTVLKSLDYLIVGGLGSDE